MLMLGFEQPHNAPDYRQPVADAGHHRATSASAIAAICTRAADRAANSAAYARADSVLLAGASCSDATSRTACAQPHSSSGFDAGHVTSRRMRAQMR